MPTRLILNIVLFCLVGCSSAQEQLRDCILESNTIGDNFFNVLGQFEDFLLDHKMVSSGIATSYLDVVKDQDPAIVSEIWAGFCAQSSVCWELVAPASTAAYIICASTEVLDTPLESSAKWANVNGDLGPEYIRHLIASLQPEDFNDLIYRGAVIQAIAVNFDRDYREELGTGN